MRGSAVENSRYISARTVLITGVSVVLDFRSKYGRIQILDTLLCYFRGEKGIKG